MLTVSRCLSGRPVRALVVFVAALATPASSEPSDGLGRRIEILEEQLEQTQRLLEAYEEELKTVRGLIPTSVKIEATGRVVHGFNNVLEWTEIPGSQGAIFCALTRVDDDSPKGTCEIGRGSGKWLYRTSGGSGDNACSARCFKLITTLQ